MSYAETARDIFMDGYGCAQAVFTAFAPLTGVEKEQALRLAMGLGGGVGRMREVCGAVSGAAMVLGALYGGDDARDKASAYAKVRQFADAFSREHKVDYFIFGHFHCRVDMPVGTGARLLVLKDWMEGSSYIVFDGTDLQIR